MSNNLNHFQFKNKLFFQDNLSLLEQLPSNSINLICSDILFNTGKKFKDFNDKLGTPQEAIEWYRPRLAEMKRVLTTDGLLYLHCDYNLSHYLKVELDNILGIENFRNEIIWHHNSAPRGKKDFGKRHNVILRYSKTKDYYFNENSECIREPYSPTAPRGYEKEKYYDDRGKIIDDVWRINNLGQNDKTERYRDENGVYDTQKPKELLYRIVDSSCPVGGVVLDCFCGSGTTLVVSQELGRNWIGCDISERAIKISGERLGIEGMKSVVVKAKDTESNVESEVIITVDDSKRDEIFSMFVAD
jgi:DNA modification methylase